MNIKIKNYLILLVVEKYSNLIMESDEVVTLDNFKKNKLVLKRSILF